MSISNYHIRPNQMTESHNPKKPKGHKQLDTLKNQYGLPIGIAQ